MFDGVENFLAPAAEEFDIGCELAINFGNQRQALREPLARTFDFKTSSSRGTRQYFRRMQILFC